MILADQFRQCVIRAPLQKVNLWSANDEELLMGTAGQESKGGSYIVQESAQGMFTKGGMGPFQMEELTYNDMWGRVIKDPLRKLIFAACNFSEKPLASEMITNLAFAAIMCRIKYLSIKAPTPAANDIPAMAAYWKKWYNTPAGAGTTDEFIKNYHAFVGVK